MTKARVVGNIALGWTEIHVSCVRPGCDHDEVSVEYEERARVFTPERSCYVCGRETPFTDTERGILAERAKHALDNYDPTDSDLRAAGMIP